MKVACTLHIEYESADKAKNILQSVTIDDGEFVTSTVKDNHIDAQIESTSVASLLHTLDDYLACLSIAEKIVEKN